MYYFLLPSMVSDEKSTVIQIVLPIKVMHNLSLFAFKILLQCLLWHWLTCLLLIRKIMVTLGPPSLSRMMFIWKSLIYLHLQSVFSMWDNIFNTFRGYNMGVFGGEETIILSITYSNLFYEASKSMTLKLEKKKHHKNIPHRQIKNIV